MSAVEDRIQTYSGEAPVTNPALNRMQDDAILNSDQIAGLAVDLHYPHVATSDNKLAFTTGADTLTITGSQAFSVGGVRFNTSDLDNLALTIPDSFDGYVRVALASGCGEVVDPDDEPIERNLNVTFSLVTGSESDAEGTGGGPSSPTSARLFHVTKGTGGTVPTVTAYEADGHDNVIQTAAEVSYADAASQRNFGNVQEALDQLQTTYTDTGAADAYVITPDPAITAYAAGQVFRVLVANANTGACTINVNSLGTKSIKTIHGANPVAGMLPAGGVVSLIYDGTNVQMLGSGGGLVRISPVTVVNAGTATSFTTVDLSGVVPVGTKAVILQVIGEGVSSSWAPHVYVRHPDDTDDGFIFFEGGGTYLSSSVWAGGTGICFLNGSRQMQYKISDNTNSRTATIIVRGIVL